jgi:type I restriction enzyme S subunit
MKDICTKIGSGATPKGGNNAYIEEGTALIRSQNILDFSFSYNGLAYINDEQASKLNGVTIKEDDVLLNITGDSVARACMVDNSVLPARVNQHVCIVRGNKSRVLSSFILYFLQMKKPELLMMASSGATRNALTKGMIEELEVELPSLEKQERMVSLLDNLQNKISKNNQINRNLSEQAMALYKKMTIDASEECIEGVLSDVAEIVMGQSPKGDTYNEDGDGTVFYQGRAEFGDRFPTRRLFTSAPKRLAKENTVLISVRAPVGDVNVAYEECCIGRGLCSVGSKDNHQSFVLYTMYSLKDQFDIYNGEGTVFGSINKDSMNGMSIQIPNKALMDKFEEIVSPMDAVIKANYEENCRLIAMRDNLLCKLMSGELDVSGVNI